MKVEINLTYDCFNSCPGTAEIYTVDDQIRIKLKDTDRVIGFKISNFVRAIEFLKDED